MTPSVDQRRSKRYPCHLPVDLLIEGQPSRVDATNVSRHGMFIETGTPPTERFVLQVMLHLPDGPLPATAFVTRRSRRGATGAGLQFFTMSSTVKQRWDYYIYWLANRSPFTQATGPTPLRRPPGEERATFLVKLESIAALKRVMHHNFPLGSIYLATPLLHRVGELVSVILIHPGTEEEFVLLGSIHRVREENPRGVEIRLEELSDAQRETFARFVGVAVEEVPRLHRTPKPREQTLDLPIDVTEPMHLERAEQLDWDSVSADLIIDLDLSAAAGTGDILLSDQPTRDAQANWPALDGDEPLNESGVTLDLDTPPTLVACECAACGPFEPPLMLGEPAGPLALLAHYHLYWSPDAKTLVSVLRLKPARERREHLGEVGGLEGEMVKQQVPLSLAFEVADLAETAKCPLTEGPLEDLPALAAVETACRRLAEQERAQIEGSVCPRLRHGVWYVSRT